MRVLIANGPNLDRLGAREPEIYGSTTLGELEAESLQWGERLGLEVHTFQTNSESELIDKITGEHWDGVVLNPGALTHTSRALADTVASIDSPVVEVHISNVREREPWRRVSFVAPVAVRTIFGRGLSGYRDALRHLVSRSAMDYATVSYGPHSDHVADARGSGPLVVLAHGGVWLPQYERDLMEGLAVELARRGMTSWNIEYRRLGDGGGWPGSAQDFLMALDHVSVHGVASEAMLVTHSAGSYLGAWAAQRTLLQVTRHIALAPLFDLESSVKADDPCAPQSRIMLDMGAPEMMRTGEIPTSIVHGKDDELVPIKHTRALPTSAHTDVLEVEGGHMSLLDPTSNWIDELMTSEGAVHE